MLCNIILIGFRYLASSIPIICLTGVAIGVGSIQIDILARFMNVRNIKIIELSMLELYFNGIFYLLFNWFH